MFASYIGGNGADQGNAIALSGSTVYLAGQTSSSNFPTTSGVVQTAFSGAQDAFVIAASNLSTSPTLVFSTLLGGAGTATGSSVAIDPSGNVVVAGSTDSSQSFPIQTSPSFSAEQWPATVINGFNGSNPTFTYSAPSTPPISVPLPTSVQSGDTDAFVASLSANGSKVNFTDFLGGDESGTATTTMAQALTVDNIGAIYVAGSSTAGGDEVNSSGTQTGRGLFLNGNSTTDINENSNANAGAANVFFAQIDPSGKYLLQATIAGGSGVDQANGLIISGPSATAGVASIVGQTAPSQASPASSLNTPDLFYWASQSALETVDPPFLAGAKGTTSGNTDSTGFFVQEALAGYCNMQLTQQAGTILTFSGPCISGTQSGTVFVKAASSSTILNFPISVASSGNSLLGTAMFDLSTTSLAGNQSLTVNFGFLPIGAVSGTGQCTVDPSGSPTNTTEFCPVATSGGGSGTIFNPTTGTFSVALSCTLNASACPSPVPVGQPVTLTAAVNNGTPGTVTWGVTPGLGSFTGPNPSSSITFTPAGTGGPVTITATPQANPSFTPVPSITLNTIASQTITFPAPSSPVLYGVSISLNATASSGLPVTFSPVSGPCTISGSTLKAAGVGTCVVAANQLGNTNFAAAPQVTQSVTVNPVMLTVTANNASIAFGSAIPTFTYAISGFVNGDVLRCRRNGNGNNNSHQHIGSWQLPDHLLRCGIDGSELHLHLCKWHFDNCIARINSSPIHQSKRWIVHCRAANNNSQRLTFERSILFHNQWLYAHHRLDIWKPSPT